MAIKVTKSEQKKIEKLQQTYSLPTEHAYNWKGAIIKNTKSNKIGWIVGDVNGYYRTLTVKYPDETIEDILLANIGANPEESKKYNYYDERYKDWNSFGW